MTDATSNQPLLEYYQERDALLAQLEVRNAGFWMEYRERVAKYEAEINALERRKEAAWAKLQEQSEPNEFWYMRELDKLNTRHPSLRVTCDGAFVREQQLPQ